MKSKLLTVLAVVCFLGIIWLFVLFYNFLNWYFEYKGFYVDFEYAWIYRLLLNLAGYATVMGPGFLLYKFLQKINYFDRISNSPPSRLSRLLSACFGPYVRLPDAAREKEPAPPERRELELALCFFGLMGAYLVWGLLQEKIMTQNYIVGDGSTVRFTDSQLLVLVNRVAALLAALAQLRVRRRPALPAALAPFSYCALSNVLSAWCQYEALKYVSFPTQVLSKSCKVIPVMLMGKLVSRNKYAVYEYATAGLISLGMVLFLLGSGDHPAHGDRPALGAAAFNAWGGVAGFVLLALYLGCDSFTATWQAALFARTGAAPAQMLAAVNLCSVALTAAALSHAPHQLQLLQHPGFLVDVVLLSASSALGQLLIYRTISSFGAVVFAIIMTLRQAVSILLSCAVFGHGMSAWGGAGAALVFAAALLRAYAARRRALKPPKPT